MPNGYGSMMVYFPVAESELLQFIRSLPKGSQCKYIRDAIRLKRIADGEETPQLAAFRRIVGEEMERVLANIALVAPAKKQKRRDNKPKVDPAVAAFMDDAMNSFGG